MKGLFRISPKNIEQIRELLRAGDVQPVQGGDLLFSYGYELDKNGHRAAADLVYTQTAEILDELFEAEQCPLSLLEFGELAMQHGIRLLNLGRYQGARTAFRRTVEILDSLSHFDVSSTVIARLASALNWLGLAQRKLGDRGEARRCYQRALALWRNLLLCCSDPTTRISYTRGYSVAMLGLAKCRNRSQV